MQRVRVGLTGLAFIFLLVLIAAAGLRPDRSGARTEAHAETLAMLGVAPGADSGVFHRSSGERRPAPRVKRARI